MKRQLGGLLLACFLWGIPAWGQTALRSSTLSANITNSQTTFNVASGSNVTAGMLAYVDSEAMRITAVSSNTLTVQRGMEGTAARAHNSGAVIYMDTNQYFRALPFPMAGRCVGTTDLERTPLVDTASGDEYRCRNNQWDRRVYVGQLASLKDNVPILINSRDFTQASGSSIGVQSRVRQTVTTTGDVIGFEISPRVSDAGSGALIAIKADPLLQAATAARTVTAVRGLEINFDFPSSSGGAYTISGDVAALRVFPDFDSGHTFSGDRTLILAAAPNTSDWQFLLKAETGTNGWVVVGAGTYSTADGYFLVKVAGSTYRVPFFAAVD